MSPPRVMKKVWAAVENRGSPDPVTTTLQGQSDPPNHSRSEAEGDNTGVGGSSFMGEEIALRSAISSDNRSRHTSIMGGDSGIDNRSRHTSIMEGDTETNDATGEEQGENIKQQEGEGEGEVKGEEQQQQQQQQDQQRHINGNLLDISLSRRWLQTKKYCKIILCILLAVAVVACYRYNSSFSKYPWRTESPTPSWSPSWSPSQQRHDLNLQLVLDQIINPSNRPQIIHSLSISGKQHLPDDLLATVAAFTASCHPETFVLATFLARNLSDAFESQRPQLSSRQVRAVLLHAYELADRATGADAKAYTAARRTTSSPYSSEKTQEEEKEEEEEETLDHRCEELADSDYAGTYLAQVMRILKELYMAAAADGPMEERWAREVRDGFDEWFYERLLRVSSSYGKR